jgi:NhaP-type Na+/H+ or K+/H+ antiporter
MFSGALGCNYYLFKKSFTNILILSVPGAIIGAIAMGLVIKGVLGYTDD